MAKKKRKDRQICRLVDYRNKFYRQVNKKRRMDVDKQTEWRNGLGMGVWLQNLAILRSILNSKNKQLHICMTFTICINKIGEEWMLQ